MNKALMDHVDARREIAGVMRLTTKLLD